MHFELVKETAMTSGQATDNFVIGQGKLTFLECSGPRLWPQEQHLAVLFLHLGTDWLFQILLEPEVWTIQVYGKLEWISFPALHIFS